MKDYNYENIVEKITNIPRFNKAADISYTKRFLSYLNNPQEKLKVIHVAGSNGKGSVCNYIASILKDSNYKVGLFISPHLKKINERISINGLDISDQDFIKIYKKVEVAINEVYNETLLKPSFFEVVFAIACMYFEENNLDYVVLETGLGGRLDATNVIETPLITVITSLSLEHTEILGDTIEKIAFEKAGIIKKNVPLIYQYNSKVDEVISKVAKNNNSPIIRMQKNQIKIIQKNAKYIDFSYDFNYHKEDIFRVSYPSEYQTQNAVLAIIAVLELLKDKTDIDKIKMAISKSKFQGRMEYLNENIILEGAHNIAGIEELDNTINHSFSNRNIIIVFSVSEDKDYYEMLKVLDKNSRIKSIIITSMDNKRSVNAKELLKEYLIKQYLIKQKKVSNMKFIAFDNVKEAFEYANNIKKKEELIICTGSLYLISEIKKTINELL